MSERGRKKSTDKLQDAEELEPLSEDFLESVAGGLPYMGAKCPVEGCGFECSTLGELNMHVRTVHPERY